MQRTATLMMAPTAVLMNSWRDQGISYLKYLNVATEELHKCVHEAKSARYTRFSQVGYTAAQPDGSGLFTKFEKVPADPADYGSFGSVAPKADH